MVLQAESKSLLCVKDWPEMQKAVNAFMLKFCTVCTAVLSFCLYMSIEQRLCSCANFWAVDVNFESNCSVLSHFFILSDLRVFLLIFFRPKVHSC